MNIWFKLDWRKKLSGKLHAFSLYLERDLKYSEQNNYATWYKLHRCWLLTYHVQNTPKGPLLVLLAMTIICVSMKICAPIIYPNHEFSMWVFKDKNWYQVWHVRCLFWQYNSGNCEENNWDAKNSRRKTERERKWKLIKSWGRVKWTKEDSLEAHVHTCAA